MKYRNLARKKKRQPGLMRTIRSVPTLLYERAESRAAAAEVMGSRERRIFTGP